MITGRGPGAPSVTPDSVCTLPAAARGEPVDLNAIRRTDAIVDLLANRRLLRPRLLGDPVIRLLSSLNSDVDAPGRGLAGGAGGAWDTGRGGTWGGAAAGAGDAAAVHPLRPARPLAPALGGSPRCAGPGTAGARRYAGAHRRPHRRWVQAMAAAMVLTAVAAVTTAGLMVAGVLMRLGSVSPGERGRR